MTEQELDAIAAVYIGAHVTCDEDAGVEVALEAVYTEVRRLRAGLAELQADCDTDETRFLRARIDALLKGAAP